MEEEKKEFYTKEELMEDIDKIKEDKELLEKYIDLIKETKKIKDELEG